MYRALVWKERQRALRGEQRRAPGKPGGRPVHLLTGERGETLAFWHLRQAGYTIVARNRRSRGGELDLIGWDGPTLAFVEVKTRTTEDSGPPELAVSRAKQKRIAKAAHDYLRRLRKQPASYRFDIVSVFWDEAAGLRVRLVKNAFTV
ncbi:MAG: YraN family protein [Acidobacteria bacterium]|nr:YraN family protein [Acidobacteriota bacterium]